MLITISNMFIATSAAAFWIGVATLLYSTYFQRRLAAFLVARFRALEEQRKVFSKEHEFMRKEMGV